MPTLGFLKKKRTKDSSGSRDFDSSNSPASPVKDQPFGSTASHASTSNPQHHHQQQQQHHHHSNHSQSAHPNSDALATSLSAPQPTTQDPAHPVHNSLPAEHMNSSAFPHSQYSTPQSTQTQSPPSFIHNQQPSQQSHNLPSIQNLINPTPALSASQSPGPALNTPNALPQTNSMAAMAQNGGGLKPTPTPTPTPQVRTTKGKYTLSDFTIQRTLGTGSFGRVHLVQSKHNNRFYAVKVLKKAQVVKMKQVEHTNDERRMLQKVKHPFLITLWGTFQDSKNLYMVMDFVEGGELFSLLRKSQRFPNPVAKFYAAEVTLALDYLHSLDIIYRDLKPENLLLDRHGHLKITDFGFAKEVPDITWTLCGTPDYLAPEVVASKGYNKSVDWWSLGILIFEMLCGFTPFWDSGSPMRIYENILKGRVKYPPYVHPDAQDLLQKLITHDLTKRLGNLHGGSKDVMNHPWFAEVTWERLAKKDIDAPYVPPVRAGAGDASQFDKYPEETEAYGGVGDDPYVLPFPQSPPTSSFTPDSILFHDGYDD
ncbi:Pkinase-domain-containing protein [Saccharata proteae CBS 121410]|uniref:cAMP-dependent protein kinase n=1 Tax=Saccharata proteae CBS 121410 TaxID=1314787 RepID=A0A9P4LXT2_9PEZI|nr:Pkinase-domain-containing protein [Saccharata proteae CBS 121410]